MRYARARGRPGAFYFGPGGISGPVLHTPALPAATALAEFRQNGLRLRTFRDRAR
jgi:hypothetical protein